MQIIVAVDTKWGIGKNNDLLFRLPEDMQYFRAKTLGKVIVMGGNTLLSFRDSKPLPRRTNIVLSDMFQREDCTVHENLPALLESLKEYPPKDVFVVGGAMFYRTMLPYCEKAFVTKVDADGGAEVFFPNLDEMENWTETETSETCMSGGYPIRFTTYTNSNPTPLP